MLFGWNHLTRDEEDRIAAGILDNRVYGGPWHLDLQPTNRCNIDCFFCSSRWHRHDESIPWKILKERLTEAVGRDFRFLRLSGGGESLIYSDIRKLLGFCAENGVRLVDVTTNGTTLTPLAELICAAGCDKVNISLNEPTAALYAATMQTREKVFEQTLRGARAMREAANAAPPEKRPIILVQFFVWKDNFERLPEMYDLAVSLGADQVDISSLERLPREHRIPEADLPRARELLREVVQADCESGRFMNLYSLQHEADLQRVALDAQDQRRPHQELYPDINYDDERFEYCYMGWFSATVDAKGDVYPCCNFVGQERKKLGNVLAGSLAAIWDGERYRAFREEMRDVMLLEGDMRLNHRHCFLEQMCIHRFDCPYNYYLASKTAYRRVGTQMRGRRHDFERFLARGRDWASRAGGRLRRMAAPAGAASRSAPS